MMEDRIQLDTNALIEHGIFIMNIITRTVI